MQHLIISSVPFFLAAILITPQTNKTWTGREDNSWSNPNNWDPPGIPMPSDNINIPQGSPECNVDCSGICGNINNHGNLNIEGNSNLDCQGEMNNSGELNIGDGGGLEFETGQNNGEINVGDKGQLRGRGDFTNQSSGSLNLNGYGAQANIEGYAQNNGDLNFNNTNCKFEARSMDNNGHIQSPESPDEFFKSYDINIDCQGNFNNNSHIDGGQHGASVNIKAGNFNNNSGGFVKGGDGVDGGDVNIKAMRVNNRGRIQGGNGAWNGGKVFIDAERFKDYQGSAIRGGNGAGGNITILGKDALENTGGTISGGSYSKAGGSVLMFSDSLYVSMTGMMDSVISNGFVTQLRGRAIVVDTLNHPMCFYQPRIVIITTYDGFIDFSNVTTHWAVFSSYSDSEYVMISNTRRLPDSSYEVFAFGITPEDTMDADTTINLLATMRASDVIDMSCIYDTSGSADSTYFILTNLSPGRYTLHYQIHSEMGWVTPIHDSVTLSPFEESDPFPVYYNIPSLPPDTAIRDIVHRTVWIINPATSEIDTVFSDYYYLYGAQSDYYFSVHESPPWIETPDIEVTITPNPFRSSTLIRVNNNEEFSIKIYDVAGKIIHSQNKVTGTYLWTPPQTLSSGYYFLVIPKYSIHKTLLLVR